MYNLPTMSEVLTHTCVYVACICLLICMSICAHIFKSVWHAFVHAGSSSGSGVAVAARVAPWALCEDTGGTVPGIATWMF